MTKILSVKDGYDIINLENQSQQSCLKFKFPAKTINQSGSRRKSRQVFTCNRQIPIEVSASLSTWSEDPQKHLFFKVSGSWLFNSKCVWFFAVFLLLFLRLIFFSSKCVWILSKLSEFVWKLLPQNSKKMLLGICIYIYIYMYIYIYVCI